MSIRTLIKHFVTRRIFLLCTVLFLCTALLSCAYVVFSTKGEPISAKIEREKNETSQNIVNDVTELNPIQTQGIIVPHSTQEIADAVKNNDHISIGGGRNSMGGQTASERAVQIDMREYNKILSLSTSSKEITVQAGIRWRDIQDYIDPYDLSVKIMQTYSNFTVGGSLSVNVHGRYVGQGPIILSVKQFTIILADGSIVTASPQEHADIFYSAIGGMGGIGVICEVTLSLADNVNVERLQQTMPVTNYWNYFKDDVRSNPDVIFHNGDIYPPAFETVSAVSWTKTDTEPTTESRLIPQKEDYWKERIAWTVISEWPFGLWIREHILEPYIYSEKAIHTRNYEASYDLAELEPKMRDGSTYVLQEYFVPVEHFDEWIPKMKKVFIDNDVNILNVSIRHALPDTGAKLAWARKESFAFVVYYKQGTTQQEKDAVRNWTRQMIDEVLTVDGTYYLPYQPWATDTQFHKAYPGAIEYFEIKKQYDPTDKFTNKLWDTYYSEEKLQFYKKQQPILQIASTTKDYYRPHDNVYLTLPEWYIVYSAEEYAAVLRDGLPSQFLYFTARSDYWNQYKLVTNLVVQSSHDNSDYMTVLSVIGHSFSAENIVKGIYENSIGKFSEWVADHTQVPEDIYAAKVAKDYASFLYDKPWYDFPYFSYLKGVWSIHAAQDYSFGQNVRRGERKVALSLEYGVKTIYASVIAFATHSKWGVQDDIVSAVVSYDGGTTLQLLQAPHYQPFTRDLLEVLEQQSQNPQFEIFDIAGNSHITFVYKDAVGSPAVTQTTEVLRDSEIVAFDTNVPQYIDRITVEIATIDIPQVYRTLKERGIVIDHFYDY